MIRAASCPKFRGIPKVQSSCRKSRHQSLRFGGAFPEEGVLATVRLASTLRSPTSGIGEVSDVLLRAASCALFGCFRGCESCCRVSPRSKEALVDCPGGRSIQKEGLRRTQLLISPPSKKQFPHSIFLRAILLTPYPSLSGNLHRNVDSYIVER